MKCLGFLSLAGCLMVSAHAQLFTPSSMTGAALGGLAGGIIGHNNGGHTAEGVGIGAGVGLVVGALADRQERTYVAPDPTYVAAPQQVYVHSAPPPRPNLPLSGAVVGGIAGGIIGHNNGGHTAEGVAIGAGAGLLLGAIAEGPRSYYRPRRAYYVEQPPVYYAPPPQVTYAPAPQPTVVVQPSEPVVQSTTTIIQSNPSGTPAMSGANSLFGR